ncbi:MAG: hypothetical protein E6Q99_04570 [Elusimicrobia bacterium]|nr:MAG: hypothetical protein E6Q99_04570 [Elusimicrobiota bacterium]
MTDKDLTELAHDACMLASMLEGIYLLQDQATTPDSTRSSKRATNSLPPMMEATINRAWELCYAIEEADAARKRPDA